MHTAEPTWPLLFLAACFVGVAVASGLMFWATKKRIESLDFSVSRGYMEFLFRRKSSAFTIALVCALMSFVFVGIYIVRTQ